MPYGMSFTRFVGFFIASFIAVAAGSQCVHQIYRPLDDLDDLIEEAFKKRLSEQNKK
ncbi:ubiquinol-cytochrome c reductase complex assembly factor 6 sloth 2 [Xylocopa sonorina]|uniref:ubiquinol-cytochrome c reductase complex assembly factor 6 sloth 2 n=1 Tax=Xylocopa sonorina TaxID=1818115 RepID=UPI00403A9C4C